MIVRTEVRISSRACAYSGESGGKAENGATRSVIIPGSVLEDDFADTGCELLQYFICPLAVIRELTKAETTFRRRP